MKRLLLASLAAAALALGVSQARAATHHNNARVQVGVLSCNVQGGVGLIIGSSKGISCRFHRDHGPTENYSGTINKIGLDIGVTKNTHLEWLVFAATDTRYTPHALAGDYVGGTESASIGVGLGANFLVGGFHRSFALQPFSVQAQTGVNLTIALASLTLH